MNSERRRGTAQLQDQLLAHLTYAQRKAFVEDLRAFGWELVAVRQSLAKKPIMLIKGPGNGAVRIFSRDGRVDFLNPVEVRAPEPPADNEPIYALDRRGVLERWTSWLTGKPISLEGKL